jgi:molybdopterin/thiamine biosynthesis adenylyltransferase
VVFIPEPLLHLPEAERSGVARLAFGEAEPAAVRVRALLHSAAVRERRGRLRSLAKADRDLAGRFGGGTVEARWVRLDQPPTTRDPEEMLALAEAAAPGSSTLAWQQVRDGAIQVTGLVFKEETRQGEWGDAWLFVVKFRSGERSGALREGWYVTRGERFDAEDMRARIPLLAPLADRAVALVGLGALGAPIALELARAQLGELRILDFDLVEVGTTVRWPYGLAAVAAPKPEFLQQVLTREYPFTKVRAFNRMLGQVRHGRGETDFDLLGRLLDGVDVVIDASAEIGIQQFIAAIAEERRLPQVYAWATEGARGGAVARVLPGVTGCWHCLQLVFERGRIELPPHDQTGTVQPRGCASRTFTGASYDLLPIAAQVARVAVATLLADRKENEGDVFVASLPGGISPIPPAWRASPLERRSECPGCGEARAAA